MLMGLFTELEKSINSLENPGKRTKRIFGQSKRKKEIDQCQTQIFATGFVELDILNQQSANFKFYKHPAAKYIRGTIPSEASFQKFVNFLYKGVDYSSRSLKGPSQQYISKKSVLLPQNQNEKSQKKFLMLDLDETLIHSIFDEQDSYDVRIVVNKNQFRFNIRPYCFKFLQKMSQYYDIYIFTAATSDYAQAIVGYLNKNIKTIKGILHRKNCMQTMGGLKIKDLRIIKNRNIKDIILVDNLVHSFGLQLDNGIPILDFTNDKNDKQLIGLQHILLQAKQFDDVRPYLNKKLKIKQVLEHTQQNFCNLQNFTKNDRQKRHSLFSRS